MQIKRFVCFLVFFIVSAPGYAITTIVGTVDRTQVLNFGDNLAFGDSWTYVTQDGNNNLDVVSSTPLDAVNNMDQQIIFRVNNIPANDGGANPNLNHDVRLAVLHSINQNLIAIRVRMTAMRHTMYRNAPGNPGDVLSGGDEDSSGAGQYFSQHNLQQLNASYVLGPYAVGVGTGVGIPYPGTRLPFYQRGDNQSTSQGYFNYTYNLITNLGNNQYGAVHIYHTEPKALFRLISEDLAHNPHIQNVLIVSHLPMCPYCSRFLLNMLLNNPALPNIVIISRNTFRVDDGQRPNFITNANITSNPSAEDTIDFVEDHFARYYTNPANNRKKNLLIYETR